MSKSTNATSSGERWSEVKLWTDDQDDTRSLSTNARFRWGHLVRLTILDPDKISITIPLIQPSTPLPSPLYILAVYFTPPFPGRPTPFFPLLPAQHSPFPRTAYMPDYFGGQMSDREKDYDWNLFMGRPMSEQHKFITKIKMFVQNRCVLNVF